MINDKVLGAYAAVSTLPPAEQAQWYRRAAEQDHAAAQFCLGVYYYHGDGVEEDKETAVEWYRRAAEQGDPDAQFNHVSYKHLTHPTKKEE